jgi:hypothetical protein
MYVKQGDRDHCDRLPRMFAFLFVFVPFLALAFLFGLSGAAFGLLVASTTTLTPHRWARCWPCDDIADRLPGNNYGCVSGSNTGIQDEAGILPLTDWPHEFFQTLAGRKTLDPTATFGDLWDRNHRSSQREGRACR